MVQNNIFNAFMGDDMFKKSTVSFCLAMLLSAPLANACVVDVKAVTFPDIYSKADRVLLASDADIYDLKSCTKIGGAKHIDLDSFFKHEGAIYRAEFLSEDARYVLQTGEDLSGNMLVNVLPNPDWSVLNELIAILSLSKPWTPDFEKRYREIKNAYEFENIMPRVNLNASGKRNAAYLIDRFDHVMEVLNGSQNVLLGDYLFREDGAVYSSGGDLAKALQARNRRIQIEELAAKKKRDAEELAAKKKRDAEELAAKKKREAEEKIAYEKQKQIEAAACAELYTGKPVSVKITIHEPWWAGGSSTYRMDAVIIGVGSKYASVRVTDTGTQYGKVVERRCSDL